MAITSRRSTVEGLFTRSDDGCSLAYTGYDTDWDTPSPMDDPSIPRSVAVVSADGSVTVTSSSMSLAALYGTARGAALVGDGTYVLSSDVGLMAPAPLGVQAATHGVLVPDNVRGVASWRGSIFVTTASNSKGARPGVWRLNAAGTPIVAPEDGTLGEYVGPCSYSSGVDQGPYGLAIADDFTVLAAEETDGLFVFRANATQPGGGAGWHLSLAPPVTDPDATGTYAGFTHVGTDPLTGFTLVVTSYDATKSSDDDTKYETSIFEVVQGVGGWDGPLSLRKIITSPSGFDYRGAQPAPSCMPLPSSTPFPSAANGPLPHDPPSVNVAAAVSIPLVIVGAAAAVFFYARAVGTTPVKLIYSWVSSKRSGFAPRPLYAAPGGGEQIKLGISRAAQLGGGAGGAYGSL